MARSASFITVASFAGAIAPELADRTISLRELQAARTAQRRALRAQLKQRRSLADALSPPPTAGLEPRDLDPPPAAAKPSTPRLRRYREE